MLVERYVILFMNYTKFGNRINVQYNIIYNGLKIFIFDKGLINEKLFIRESNRKWVYLWLFNNFLDNTMYLS